MVEEFFFIGGMIMANWTHYKGKENLLSMIDGQAVLREKNTSIFDASIRRLKDLASVLE
jgi:hypothetical protein